MTAQAGPSGSAPTLKTSKLSPVVLDNHSSSGIGSNISLHPLPILNISEHLVRTRLQSDDAELTVYGVLLGTQQGRDIEIQNSFEIRLDPASSTTPAPMINHAFLKSRQAQYKQVFPTLDLLGWYTIGDIPTPQDLEIHKQLLAYNETPLLVQLHQTVSSFEDAEVNGELPIRIYESVVELVQGETTNFFVPAGYKIETGEAEHIAVDHASKAGAESGGDHESTMLASMQAQHSAISKLNDRIRQVLTYLQSVKDGQAAWDHEALRQIQTVAANLPQTVLPELQEELLREHNDVLLTNYLSVLTESLHTMNELTDKFEVVQAGAKDDAGEGGIAATSTGGAPSRRGAGRSSALRAVYG
ncbi:related to COP9 signalosome complex subunit 6 [Sporisorium reilianum SRZ2]|uniref:COP9 signalosome complex subunit 6 n=1 Tax=Sporisorium reilianum (strain SRZ2) TaxID=999809 RepID=E6ZL53_SPORE|nr:related to COP9 signalosome complex subunit 6 [Sporisorium reilianum SRZ2]